MCFFFADWAFGTRLEDQPFPETYLGQQFALTGRSVFRRIVCSLIREHSLEKFQWYRERIGTHFLMIPRHIG